MAIDEYASSLLEMSKRFFEKGKGESEPEKAEPYFTAALLTGVSALEAHLNSIAEEMVVRPGLNVLELSLLQERDYRLDKGDFQVGKSLKMYRLEDRLEFLFKRFTKSAPPRAQPWWGALQAALDLRNKVVHPKDRPAITKAATEKAIEAILECLNAVYLGLYRKGLPGFKRGLDSTMTF